MLLTLPTEMTVALADAGSTLSESEGASIDICVTISQGAAGRRECPINITLISTPIGDNPGEWNN